MRGAEKLSATKVAKLKEAGRYGDGRGLYLQIGPTGNKSWLFRYMIAGKAREMGLGPLHTIGLAAARDRAREARRLILDGKDPIDVRRTDKVRLFIEAAKAITFEEAAKQYVAAHSPGWKNKKHAAQWTATLIGPKAVTASINPLPVSQVDTALVMKALEPIWKEKPETATRVRGRIERVLAWATVRGFRQGDNPARWRGHLKEMLPAKSKIHKVKHHPALAYDQAPAFMADLRTRDSISARALEFTILNASRTEETIGARWDEIDLTSKIWTVPAARMKAEKDHRVPLTPCSIEILKALPREAGGEFVFPGGKAKQHLSNAAMAELLKGMAYPSTTPGRLATVHGFRSTFRDWAAEQTNYPREVAEAALAHVTKDKTEAAYKRGDALEKRRRLMSEWERYCSKPAPVASTVTPMRERA